MQRHHLRWGNGTGWWCAVYAMGKTCHDRGKYLEEYPAVCKFKSHQITLELPANLCNGHHVVGIQWLLYLVKFMSNAVHCKVLWWPNQEVIKIHDPFATLAVRITLNSTCGQQALHPTGQ